MRIYTRTGDDGTTGLYGGGRVSKADPRVDAYGEVDELNSVFGWALAAEVAEPIRERLSSEQDQLFRLGAMLADPSSEVDGEAFAGRVEELEMEMDRFSDELEPLKSFILPAGSESVVRLHLARTVCRRAERATVALAESAEIDPTAVQYLNRLSDYLFVAARFEAARRGEKETVWEGS